MTDHFTFYTLVQGVADWRVHLHSLRVGYEPVSELVGRALSRDEARKLVPVGLHQLHGQRVGDSEPVEMHTAVPPGGA